MRDIGGAVGALVGGNGHKLVGKHRDIFIGDTRDALLLQISYCLLPELQSQWEIWNGQFNIYKAGLGPGADRVPGRITPQKDRKCGLGQCTYQRLALSGSGFIIGEQCVEVSKVKPRTLQDGLAPSKRKGGGDV